MWAREERRKCGRDGAVYNLSPLDVDVLLPGSRPDSQSGLPMPLQAYPPFPTHTLAYPRLLI